MYNIYLIIYPKDELWFDNAKLLLLKSLKSGKTPDKCVVFCTCWCVDAQYLYVMVISSC